MSHRKGGERTWFCETKPNPNLLAPITDSERVDQAWRGDADAITLDLEDGVVETRKGEARGLVKETIARAGQGGAEVFVRVNSALLRADLDASVWPGVHGIMLPRVESAAEVAEAVEVASFARPGTNVTPFS